MQRVISLSCPPPLPPPPPSPYGLRRMHTNSPLSSSSVTNSGGAMCIRVQTRAVSSLYTQVILPHHVTSCHIFMKTLAKGTVEAAAGAILALHHGRPLFDSVESHCVFELRCLGCCRPLCPVYPLDQEKTAVGRRRWDGSSISWSGSDDYFVVPSPFVNLSFFFPIVSSFRPPSQPNWLNAKDNKGGQGGRRRDLAAASLCTPSSSTIVDECLSLCPSKAPHTS